MQRDLARWLHLMADDTDGWVPQWFEFAFGLAQTSHATPPAFPTR